MGINYDGSAPSPILFNRGIDYFAAVYLLIHFLILQYVGFRSILEFKQKALIRNYMIFSVFLHSSVDVVQFLHYYFDTPAIVHWVYCILLFVVYGCQIMALTQIALTFGHIANSSWMARVIYMYRGVVVFVYADIIAQIIILLPNVGKPVLPCTLLVCVDSSFGVFLGAVTEVFTFWYLFAFAIRQSNFNQNKVDRRHDSRQTVKRDLRKSLLQFLATLAFLVLFDLCSLTVYLIYRYDEIASVQLIVNTNGFWSVVLIFFTFKQMQVYLKAQNQSLDAPDQAVAAPMKFLSSLRHVPVQETATIKLGPKT